MEVIILSKEKVKPSTPTPPDRKSYNLCIFDQMYGGGTAEFILFYKTAPAENHFRILKETLSDTLTLFRPLAGQVTQDGSTKLVHCNDNGIVYVEARVNVRLSQFLENHPDHSQLKKFFQGQDDTALGSVHVTRFECGGVAIGGAMPHILFDAPGMSRFFNTWAKIARGGNINDQIPVDFASASSLFPAQHPFPQELLDHWRTIVVTKGEFLLKRFVFDAKAIAVIKREAVSETVPNPSRVEALTAFMWKHLMLAKKAVNGNNSTPYSCSVSHSVDLRQRLDPPVPNAFGNLVWTAAAFYEISTATYPVESRGLGRAVYFETLPLLTENREIVSERDPRIRTYYVSSTGVIELSDLVGIVREMFESLKGEKLKAWEGDAVFNEQMDALTNPEKLKLAKLDKYLFNSWCRLGLNDVDFGWGKPIWVVPMFVDPSYPMNVEKVVFVDSGWSDGIEAWVLRNKEEMLVLENNEEFLRYASPDPSICFP